MTLRATLALTATLLMTMGHAGSTVTITNFDDYEAGLDWRSVNDTVMGGRSSGDYQILNGSLLFKGMLNTNGGGFSSIRTAPQNLKLDAHERIRMKVKGDGRTYKLRLISGKTGTTYVADFQTGRAEWDVIEVPFSAFQASWRGRLLDRPPIEPADITSIGIMIADKRDGPFELAVDWIEAL